MHVHADNDKVHPGSSVKGRVVPYAEGWHSVRAGQSEGGGTCC